MSSLLRLLQFAKPRKKAIALGLLLTLLATVVASISPLIYMVLIDDVLIDWEAGRQNVIDVALLVVHLWVCRRVDSCMAARVDADVCHGLGK